MTVISEKEPWLERVTLTQSDETLYGPGGTRLPVIGEFETTLKYKGKSISEKAFVIKNQRTSLLSRHACRRLDLIKRINEVTTTVTPDFKSEFPSLFHGLGKLKTEYHINLKQNGNPKCLFTPRKVPHPLLPKVKAELDKMLQQGVISQVTTPTDWCSGMVCVEKPNGSVRICVDLTALNQSVKREIHPMASVDDSLAKLSNGKIFTKLDANSGFWQLPLDEESRLLTSFITPFGRYYFNRLPFGISSAPEIFQRAMSRMLEGLDGITCHMDDILIQGATQSEHDTRVRAVLQRLREEGLTLNDKCEFSKREIRFLGHIVNSSGIRADGRKITAITQFPTPTTVTELQRLMGMVNQLGKFIPHLADVTEPMRQLLRKDTQWFWDTSQQIYFQDVKDLLVSMQILAHYNPKLPTVIAADASAYGIGAVLIQVQNDGKRRPVSYASRSLTDAETWYAVIEKEALAATWACEKFAEYVVGLHFTLETDHKPLLLTHDAVQPKSGTCRGKTTGNR